MIERFIADVWFALYGTTPRGERVDDAACADATREERQRIATWAKARGLVSRENGIFEGVVGDLFVRVEDGCDARLPEGVEIVVAARDVEKKTLAPLFEDIDLDGSLWRAKITDDAVRLVFHALRSTDVYDVALKRIEELLKPAAPPPPVTGEGPYR